MRTYDLVIGSGTQQFKVSQNIEKPSGLCIQANIQHFNQGQTTNSSITVYNLPLWFYGNYQKLYNMPIELRAGYSDTPITRKLGYQKIENNLIIKGFITSVIPDPNALDRPMTFIIQATPFYLDDEFGGLKERTPDTAIDVTIQKGENPINAITNAFNQLTGNIPFFASGTFVSPVQINASITNINDLFSIAKQTGYILYQYADGFSMYAISEGNTASKNIVINKSQYLTQPSGLDLNTVAVTTVLRGDIQLLDTFELDKSIFVGISALDEVRAQSGNAQFRETPIYLWYEGKYQVTKVWHVLDSQNTDVQAWATHIEGVRA